MSIVRDLGEHVCVCVFDLPASEWPIPGSPAWVYVLDADMGMIKLQPTHSLDSVWVNTSIIKTLRVAG